MLLRDLVFDCLSASFYSYLRYLDRMDDVKGIEFHILYAGVS